MDKAYNVTIIYYLNKKYIHQDNDDKRKLILILLDTRANSM